MICLNCDNEHFEAGEAEIKQEFRGETLMVKTPVVICQTCGWQTIGNDQIDELRKRTADTYRKKHGLLTTAQIRAMREALRMNQPEFADFLRVGVASVKRWETWLVQDGGNDELIRVKCVMAKKAEIIKRVTNLLLQHAATATPATDWQQAVKQAKPLLASFGRYLQIAQPGTQHKIKIKLTVHTKLVNWPLSTQPTATPAQPPSALFGTQFHPQGVHPVSLTTPVQLSDRTAVCLGSQPSAPANRFATKPLEGETSNDPALTLAA
jgi:putative zinc finger/helix-turn-helix YgiT family protein